jgi:transcription initiation factor TFIID TATA-box-binding protein
MCIGEMIEVVNVVGGGDLGREIKLGKVYQSICVPVLRYDPELFSGLYMRFDENGPTVMLFSSGKYNIAGADSVESLSNAHDQLIDNLEGLGMNVSNSENETEIRNQVCIHDYDHELELSALLTDLGFEDIEYDPESFPGLMYRPDEGGLLIVFRSGKLMITGLSDLKVIIKIIERFKSRIDILLQSSD